MLCARVLDDRLRATGPALLEAVSWALRAGADLVNLSLGLREARGTTARRWRWTGRTRGRQVRCWWWRCGAFEPNALATLGCAVAVGCHPAAPVPWPDPTGGGARPSPSFAAATATRALARRWLAGGPLDPGHARAWLRSHPHAPACTLEM
ncbi:MAG: hypothetical protein R3F59_12870 [Myxococcota bacterium]